jgi:undecaprenyl-diphosphatase
MQTTATLQQFFLLIYLHFFKMLQQADINLLKLINLHRVTFLDPFFIFITDIATIITYSVPIILLIYAYAKHRFVLQRKSWLVLIALGLNSVIVDILKKLVHRPRPFVTYPYIHNLVPVSSFSFPSGHTAEVSMLAISVSLLFSGPQWGIALAWLWALLIGYSRMDLGVHYPGDVLGSFIISTFVAFIFIKGMISLDFLQKKEIG